MRIAFLSDVHGNLPALDAVLDHARGHGAEAFWDGGDTVGYFPWPDACVQRLAEVCEVTILGNYDRKVLKVPERRDRWRARKDPLKAEALIWAHDELAPASRQLLAARDAQVRRQAGGRSLLICHGSPLGDSEVVDGRLPPARWRTLARAAACDVVLHGHTHVPGARREMGTLFYSPGALGRSEDGDPRASYALLTSGRTGVTLTRHRVAYDTGQVVDEIRRRGLPEEFAVMVRAGISLARARRRLRAGRR
jgi:predicted phosphodiesterase